MHNAKLLKQKIEYEGIKLVVLSYKLGMSRTTLWSRLNGQSEFTSDEVKDLIKVLHLNDKEQEKIFNISSKDNDIYKRRPYVKRFDNRR